jgi:5-formyltetrahydrofolate cyclo-ligase
MRVAPSPTKSELRKQLRTARRCLPAAEYLRRSRLAVKNVVRLPGFACGKRVAVYLPFDNETDTALLLREARRRGVLLYVPVVIDRRRHRMQFHALKGPLKRGHYGIQVPHRSASALPARWLNLVVTPLVGVDDAGRRLGMGAGFYDRALAFRRVHNQRLGPHVAGLAFGVQRTDETFAEPWDIRLDSLATESGLHFFSDQEGAT